MGCSLRFHPGILAFGSKSRADLVGPAPTCVAADQGNAVQKEIRKTRRSHPNQGPYLTVNVKA